MTFVHFLLAVVSFAWVATASAQQCLNCASVVKCAGGDCYQMGNVQRPLVGDARPGTYCWEYCWGKVDSGCKKDFYSDIKGAWRCPAGQVCRYDRFKIIISIVRLRQIARRQVQTYR